MLKDFRSIDVYWDKATRRIYEEIRSSSSDEKGRKLTVQIVNDGQIQDLTNVALNLYWETQDGENRGLDPFEPLDAENGIYELYFRTGMLKHVGKLNAHLHLVDTTGAITSEPFTIFVFEGVDVDAIASEDELSALTQALVEVQTFKEGYSALDGRITAVADGALQRSGGTMTGPIAMSGKKITGLAEPVANNDAVNKGYVDNIKISGQNLLLDSEKERPTTRLLVITVGDILADHVGKEIEVSFDMKTAGTLRDIRVYNYQNSGFSIADVEYFQNTELNKWERFGFITTVVQRAGTYNIGAIAWYDEAGDNNYAVRKINIKLRHKTTESDWTPALKDIGLPKNIFSDCVWSDVGTYSARRARVYEGLNMVYIHAVKVMPSQQTETFICRLPSAYRPPINIKAPWSNQYTHGGIVCEASTGNITAYSKDAVVGFDVNIWIPLGSA